jgi:hypothetical protein
VLPESLAIKIRFAIEEIDRELAELDLLYKYAQHKDLDKIYTLAAAGALHGLYTGIESIFKMVQASYYGSAQNNRSWHHELLISVSHPLDNMRPLISLSSVEMLKEFLSFRHFYRNHYSSMLDPSQVREKLLRFPAVWEAVKNEIEQFMEAENSDNAASPSKTL